MIRFLCILTLTLLFSACAPTAQQLSRIEPGMYCSQVHERLGRPTRINVHKHRSHERRQWVYRMRVGHGYVYFDGSCRVTGVQY